MLKPWMSFCVCVMSASFSWMMGMSFSCMSMMRSAVYCGWKRGVGMMIDP